MRICVVHFSFAVALALLSVAAIARGHLDQGKSNSQGISALLKAARDAIGGEAKLAAVKSLLFKGEEKGHNEWFGKVPGASPEWMVRSYEMKMLFPDRFSRAWGPMTPGSKSARIGFSGKDPVPALEPGKTPSQDWQETLEADKAQLGRLMLMLLLRTDGAAPATLRAAAGSESKLEVLGLGPFPGYLELDPTTHIPLRFQYQMRMRTAVGPTGEISQNTISADDWKNVGGIKLPYHLIMTREGQVHEDYRFQTIQVNPLLTAADFK